MAGQAKRDPATQLSRASAMEVLFFTTKTRRKTRFTKTFVYLRNLRAFVVNLSCARTRALGGRVKPGHDGLGMLHAPQAALD